MNARIAATSAALAILFSAVAPAAFAGTTVPANDAFGAPAAISQLPFSGSLSTAGSTLEAGEPQPSCGSIRSSVWYSFAPQQGQNVDLQISASFKSAVTVYTGTTLSDLTEVACQAGSNNETSKFAADSGKTYFVQVGNVGHKQGGANISVTPDSWQEKTIAHQNQPVTIPDINVTQLMVDGRPRANDPSMYDLTISAAGQPAVSRGLLTFGLVRQEIHQEVGKIPSQTVSVDVTVTARYDSSQYDCLSDGGPGQSCVANSPVRDLGWLTTGQSSDAQLTISIRAISTTGGTLVDRTIFVPIAGQVLGLVP